MRRVALMVLLSIAVAGADDKDKARYAPGPAKSYAGHQTMDKITIAAVPFLTDEQAQKAFGKKNPYKYGVLPVLVILENGTGKALRLDLEAQYVRADGKHVDATPASDVIFVGASGKAPKIPGESPIPWPRRVKSGPLNIWEIEGRAFSAKMLPENDSVYGFFYFQVDYQPGSKMYLTGLKEAATGKDFFFFEVPIEKQ
jgi:hypothetical protein